MPETKEKKTKKTSSGALKKMIRTCRRYIPAVIIATLFTLGNTATTLISPSMVGKLMDTIVAGVNSGVNMADFMGIVKLMIILYAAGTVFAYGQQFIITTVTQRVAKNLRSDLSRKFDRIALNYYDSTEKGDILSVMTNDIGTVSSTLASSAANIIGAGAQFAGVMIMMFLSSGLLSAVSIGAALLGFIIMLVIMAKARKYFQRRQEHLGNMNGQIEEVYTNLSIVSAFGGRRMEQEKFDKINALLFEDNWKSTVLTGATSQVMSLSGSLSYILIFIVGVSMILKGSTAVTLGGIMEFIMYNRLFTSPLSTFSSAMAELQQAAAASERVFRLLEQPELADESGKTGHIEAVRGDVSFEDVHFGYSPDKEIIHGFSAAIRAGQKVAIVGPTGAGKTTIVNLLMRFYEPDSGLIRIDGVPISDVSREEVHGLFDMILQDTWLFEGTIRENLAYNTPDVTDEQLSAACRTVGLEHFIRTLPQGFDTPLSDTLNLSEGQKQQLTIARAVLKNAPLLILDEATSSVDTRTELVIQRAMDELMRGRTSFIIAHRLSTIKNADLILVMRDGNVVETGTHTELLAKNGFYAEMYNSQFELI